MSYFAVRASDQVTLRKVGLLDLPRLAHIEAQIAPPRWEREQLLWTLQSGGVGISAEVAGKTVGFVLYLVTPPAQSTGLHVLKQLIQLLRAHGRETWAPQRTVVLLRMAVLPDWQRAGVGSTLLKAIHRKYWLPSDFIEATVHEGEHAAQKFLQQSGYEIVSIQSGDEADETCYVMQRVHRRLPTGDLLTKEVTDAKQHTDDWQHTTA
jgi:ribosomal protein S18 acetylase RimI-like enzyme